MQATRALTNSLACYPSGALWRDGEAQVREGRKERNDGGGGGVVDAEAGN